MKKEILLILTTLASITTSAGNFPKEKALQFLGTQSFGSLHPCSNQELLHDSRAIFRSKQSNTETESRESKWIPSRDVIARQNAQKKERLDSILGYDNEGNLTTRQIFKFDTDGRLVSRTNAFREDNRWNTVEEYLYVWNDQGLILSEQCIGYGSGLKYDYKYNSAGLGIEKLTSYYTDDQWVLSEKGEYQYDGNANITDELLSMMVDSKWVPSTHNIATYTTLNRQSSFEGYYWNGSGWEGIAKENYSYFGDYTDLLTRTERFLWIPSEGKFRNADIIIQEFNDNAQCTLQQRVFWNEERQDWSGVYPSWDSDVCYNIKSCLNYDDRHRMTEDITYTDFEGNGEWTKMGDMLYSYTDLDNGIYRMEMIGNLYTVYPGEVFNDQCRYAMFDAEGRKLWMVQQVRPGYGQELVNDFEEKYEYDRFGNTTRFASWNWDGMNRINDIQEVSTFDSNGDISEQNFFCAKEGYTQLCETLVGNPEWTQTDNDGWENMTRFSYEYIGGTRVSKMGWIWNEGEWLANFGADVEYDFTIPMSEIIFPDITDDPFKIISAGNYTGNGGVEFNRTLSVYHYSSVNGASTLNVGAESWITFNGEAVILNTDATIRVYDMNGNTVSVTYGNHANLSHLPAGIYVVNASADNTYETIKIVKK